MGQGEADGLRGADGKAGDDTASQEPDLKIDGEGYTIAVNNNSDFLLYNSLKFFYQNGGGTCFIIAVGTYGNQTVAPDFNKSPFEDGIKRLEKVTDWRPSIYTRTYAIPDFSAPLPLHRTLNMVT